MTGLRRATLLCIRQDILALEAVVNKVLFAAITDHGRAVSQGQVLVQEVRSSLFGFSLVIRGSTMA